METIITGTASKDSRKIQLDHVFTVYDGFNNYQGLILLVPQETQGSQDYLQPLPTLEMPWSYTISYQYLNLLLAS